MKPSTDTALRPFCNALAEFQGSPGIDKRSAWVDRLTASVDSALDLSVALAQRTVTGCGS